MILNHYTSTILVGVFVLTAAALIIGAAIAGVWLGATSRELHGPGKQGDITSIHRTGEQGSAPSPPEPPVCFWLDVPAGADMAAVEQEVSLAAEAGIHQYMAPIKSVWPGDLTIPESATAVLDLVTATDPDARVFVRVDLNPSQSWLNRHPESAVQTQEGGARFVSLHSGPWVTDVESLIGSAVQILRDRQYSVAGYVLECQEEGRWFRSSGYDMSEPCTEAFRRWLRTEYADDDAALQSAWGDSRATLDGSVVPQPPETDDPGKVFFALPEEQRCVDYLRFNAEATARAMTAFAAHLKNIAGSDSLVLVPYGYSFELVSNAAGHLALSSLLDGPIDGFVSPVSYHDRGLGGAGGFMGPVDSAIYHHKKWFIIDDTRTGITRDSATGNANRPAGLRAEDVANVQERNYAAALAHGLGLAWADPEGKGALMDAEAWSLLGSMQSAYADYAAYVGLRTATARADPNALSPPPVAGVTLCVVVDETSRFYQRCDAALNQRLLLEARDCAVLTGVPAHFCLLQDVLDDRAVPASVYLFLNAFYLSESARSRLHDLLAAKAAAAIWMYAPGYIDGAPSTENITATTGIRVAAFKGVAESGSVYRLETPMMRKGETFGEPARFSPLFYVDDDDPNITVLAAYRETEKPSVAMKFLEQGWTSVYIAEPTLSPALLRQILRILEKHVYVSAPAGQAPDVTYFGPHLIAVHGRAEGERERTLELTQKCDIQDLLDPKVGWLQKRVLNLPLRFGQTRVLKLAPVPSGNTEQ